MKSRNLIIGAILAVVVAVGFGAYQMSRLSTVRVMRGEIASSVFASGKTEADSEAHLSFVVAGKLAALPVKEGGQVTKGQVVASLDRAELALVLARAEDDLRQAEAELAKAYDEVKGHEKDETYTQRQTRTQAEVKRDKAVKSVVSARKALADSSLYAPFSGVVTKVDGAVGEWVSPYSTKSLVVVIDPATVYFEAELDEENLSDIQVGQEARVTLDAYPGRQFGGTVLEINKKAVAKDNGDTVLPVKVSLSGGDVQPIAGLNGDVQFLRAVKKGVLLVPKHTVSQKQGQVTVTLKRGIFQQTVAVETGIADAKNIEIIKGVSESDQVVITKALE